MSLVVYLENLLERNGCTPILHALWQVYVILVAFALLHRGDGALYGAASHTFLINLALLSLLNDLDRLKRFNVALGQRALKRLLR